MSTRRLAVVLAAAVLPAGLPAITAAAAAAEVAPEVACGSIRGQFVAGSDGSWECSKQGGTLAEADIVVQSCELVARVNVLPPMFSFEGSVIVRCQLPPS